MRILVMASIAVLIATGSAVAKKPDQAHGRSNSDQAISAEGMAVAFSHLERQLIVEYYESHRDGHGLPPGLARKVARGGPVPPGHAKRILPDELEVRLPPPPRGFERMVVEGRVVLVETASQVIHDVLMDVIVAR